MSQRVTAAMFRRPLERDAMLPEFRALRRDPARAARSPVARKTLAACRRLADRLTPVAALPYSLFAEYARTGVRRNFDSAYFARRRNLSAAALLAIFRRRRKWLDLTQDYIWAVCEETTWVPPEHSGSAPIDLFAAETAFALAETAHLLGDSLDREIADRIGAEIDRRILTPYIDSDWVPWWMDGRNNWSGVCNSSVGAAFLYVERDAARLARAVNKVLAALDVFIDRAFLADGGSSEGAGYWQYGLINTVYFAELLRRRTAGRLDFLAHPKFRKIALYPLAAAVAPGQYYTCSDCTGSVRFAPGFIARLARRTGARQLEALLNDRCVASGAGDIRSAMRDILWWNGIPHRPPPITDSLLPDTAVARLVDPKRRLVLMAKAGHNAENHNHNDVGSLALYAGGESLLCDAGAGLYDRAYFGPNRYANPVCNSYGHSVPRIGGALQETGREYAGRTTAFETRGPAKRLAIEFAGAYALKGLRTLERSFALATRGRDAGCIRLEDTFAFAGPPPAIEEAFVTWGRVTARGSSACIRGERSGLVLQAIEPAGTRLRIEDVPIRLAHSPEPRTLRRIAFVLPRGSTRFVLEMKPVRKRAE